MRAIRFIFTVVLLLNFSCFIYAGDVTSVDIEQLDFANGLFQRELYQMAINEYKSFITSFPENEYLYEA